MEPAGRASERELRVPLDREALPGVLRTPAGSQGLVVFAHGSGSSRLSPRNRLVALALNEAGLATYLTDLLLPREADDRRLVFDVDLLRDRLALATEGVRAEVDVDLPLGYFGASTGAAAALAAAARTEDAARAVVSRGGRPDLALPVLGRVRAPTLLIVGGRDDAVIGLNQQALAALRCERRLEIVAGATHLFEEAGALERVAALARGWFVEHLVRA